MRRLIRGLDKFFAPALILGYFGLCICLLAVSEGRAPLLSMLWAALMMAAMRWGIWGILKLTQKQTRQTPALLLTLTRTVEVLMLLLTVGAAVFAFLLWELPAVWLLIPACLFGLQGAVHFDAREL